MLNKWVSSLDVKCEKELILRCSDGREFQSWEVKALLPMVTSRTVGIEEEDLRI